MSLERAREQLGEKLIVALDFPSAARCFSFLGRLEHEVPPEARLRWVKVGLELYLAEGPALVRELRARKYQVFLDLKLHDIPNTAAGAVRSVLPLEAALLTVHAGGGPAMLRAAAEAASGSGTRMLAVTVLTSMDARELASVGVPADPAHQVARLGQMAAECGISGVVCSASEAAELRALLPGAHLVTPGIRPSGAAADDQQRVSTPAEALRNGANQIVVGRPITGAENPARAYLAMLNELAGARDA